MTAIHAVAMNPVAAGPLPQPPAGPASAAPLLPQPQSSTGIACNDAMAMLYTAMSHQNAQQVDTGEATVTAQKGVRDAENKKEEDALARQEKADGVGSKGLFATVTGLVKDVACDIGTAHFADAVDDTGKDVKAAWNSPKFWQDVEFGAKTFAEGCAILGSAALTAVTFGGAAPGAVAVTAVILSAAGQVESTTHVLEKCGVDAKIGTCIGAVLTVAGAAVSALGSGPAALSALAQTEQDVGTAMNGASAYAQVVSSSAHVKTGNFAADAQDAGADATQADNRMKSIQRTIGMIVDGIKDASESNRRAMQSLQGAMQTNAQTLVVASGRMA